MRQYLSLSPILSTKQQCHKNRAVVLQMLLKKQASNTLPAARKWSVVVVERLTNGTLQEHHKPLRIHKLAVFLSDNLPLQSQSKQTMAF